jgi:16S rRNA (cytidine1402-2'-O)-methyltransferase
MSGTDDEPRDVALTHPPEVDHVGTDKVGDPGPHADPATLSKGSGLVLVATPIGHLGDISARALEALRGADLVLCEDTRTTGRLFQEYGITVRMDALHDHNEAGRTPALVARLLAGARMALVSDAGTPLVSDPGFRLVRAAIEAGVPVSAVPGPNAAVMALVLSGLPPQPFLFMGFPPPRSAARLAGFGQLRAAERAGLRATLLWHEAPHRLAEALADLAAAFGDRPAAVCRELTKRFEEIRRGRLPELAAWYAAHAARGEITVVVGPAGAEETDAEDLDGQLRRALQGASVREAAALVAAATGLPRKVVYARALVLSGEANAL